MKKSIKQKFSSLRRLKNVIQNKTKQKFKYYFSPTIITGMISKIMHKGQQGIKLSNKNIIESFLKNLQLILNHFHSDGIIYYQMSVTRLLQQQSNQIKIKLQQSLNTINEQEPLLRQKKYEQIQSQIINEWEKQDYFLSKILNLWIECLLKSKMMNKECFLSQLQNQKGFIGQLSYLMFGPYFLKLIKSQYPVLERLVMQSSIFIITSNKNWKKVNDNIILQIFKDNNEELNFDFNLKTLDLGDHILDNNKQNQYQKTILSLKNQSKEINMLQKIYLTNKVRKQLEQQVKQYQINKVNGFKIIQKDDIIGILIYCIVNGQIQDVVSSIRYFDIMFGETSSEILSRWKINSYRIDIESAVCYLLQNTLVSSLISKV